MKHIMVDLETLSSKNNAAIASIGAIEFNPETGKQGQSFYEIILLPANLWLIIIAVGVVGGLVLFLLQFLRITLFKLDI